MEIWAFPIVDLGEHRISHVGTLGRDEDTRCCDVAIAEVDYEFMVN